MKGAAAAALDDVVVALADDVSSEDLLPEQPARMRLTATTGTDHAI